MDKYDRFAALVDWLAMPVVYFILLVIFLLFVVRPFFAYLFNPDRIIAVKKLREARQQPEETAVETSPEQEGGDEELQFTDPSVVRENLQQINKLAKSDPTKAGTLVKEWLKQDQNS